MALGSTVSGASKKHADRGKRIASPPETGEIAASLAKIGWPVFPVTVYEDATGKRHKVPAVKWKDEATTDVATVNRWWDGYRGQPVALQRKEFLLLHELLAQPGRVLTRDRLQQALYGWGEEAESNTLEVHIHHLRRKLFPELIRTVRGVGYLVDKV